MPRIRAFIHGTDGAIGVLMAMAMVVLAGFSAYAVDLGYLHMKRGELQTAADNAALAGAVSLLSLRGDEVAIRAEVVDYARANLADIDVPVSAVSADDVILSNHGNLSGDPDVVEVTIRRTRGRNNPVSLFFGRILGTEDAELTATARAALVPICASRCVKPFIVPTKFDWDDSASSDSKHVNNGELDVDSPEEMASIQVLGYDNADVGARITLKFGDPGDTMVPSQYSPVDFPPMNKGVPVTGASEYKANLSGCEGSNRTLVELDDELYLEPGNMVGPTSSGLSALLSDDPFAYWDEATNSVKESVYDDPLSSPRVAIIAFFDPRRPPTSGRNSLYVDQLGAVFIEGEGDTNGSIQARFMNTVARSPSSQEGECLIYLPRLVLDSSRGA